MNLLPRARPTQRLFRASVLLLVLVSGFLAAACATIASPRGWASPVLTDARLLAAHRDSFFALDPDTFDVRWAFPSDGDDDDVDLVALYGTPALLGDTVFLPAYDGNLYALEVESGDLLPGWPFETDGPIIGGVTVSQDTVYFGSSDGSVYALDAASGQLRWPPFETGDEVWSAPTLAGDTLYVTSLDGRLYALEAASGMERWSFQTEAGLASPPVVDQELGLVFVGGLDSRMHAIDLTTHEERWSFGAGNWFWTRPLLAGGTLYAGSLDRKLYAWDAAAGQRRWRQPFPTQAPIRSAPLLVGDVLIAIDRDGSVYGIDPEDGAAAFEGPLALGADVLADPVVRVSAGRGGNAGGEEVVVVTTKGELVRIDPAALEVIGRKELAGE